MAPGVNLALSNDRQTVTNYMLEAGAIATTCALTTSSTIATIAIATTLPPKPILRRIMIAGVAGTVLGGAIAFFILWYYRKQILRNLQ